MEGRPNMKLPGNVSLFCNVHLAMYVVQCLVHSLQCSGRANMIYAGNVLVQCTMYIGALLVFIVPVAELI